MHALTISYLIILVPNFTVQSFKLCFRQSNTHFHRLGALTANAEVSYCPTRLPLSEQSISVEQMLSLIKSYQPESINNIFQDNLSFWIGNKSEEYNLMYCTNSSRTALDDPNLLGNYDVAYVGTGSSQRGNPAGGRYRGSIGSLLFSNEGTYQHILKDDTTSAPGKTVVINYIRGKLLGFLTLSVVLKGAIRQLSEGEISILRQRYGTPLSKATVRATFEPPLIAVHTRFKDASSKPAFTVRVGPTSTEDLDTPYVDSLARLGRGARGSTFVFRRTVDPLADAYKVLMNQRPISGLALGSGLSGLGGVLTLMTLKATKFGLLLRCIFGLFSIPALFVGMFLLISKGGIVE